MTYASERMVIAGGSGFLGRALARYFEHRYDVVVLSRTSRPVPGARVVEWDGCTMGAWSIELEGAAVLINLSGRSVNCRATRRNKREMMDSRVLATRVLGDVIAICDDPPPVWINAGTATIYRHSLERAYGEDGEIGATPGLGDGFAIEIAMAWEQAFGEAARDGVRQIIQRTAMVMGNEAETVYDVLSGLARRGIGGRQGSGDQFVSWLHIDDYCRITDWMINTVEAEGVYNVCAPEPVTNAAMMAQFRKQVGATCGLPSPRWLLEVGAFFMRTETELILKSRNTVPRRLLAEGFEFQHSEFAAAMAALA